MLEMYKMYFFSRLIEMEVKQEPSSSMETDQVKDATNDHEASGAASRRCIASRAPKRNRVGCGARG